MPRVSAVPYSKMDSGSRRSFVPVIEALNGSGVGPVLLPSDQAL